MAKSISRALLWALAPAFLVTLAVSATYLLLPYDLPGTADITKVKEERLPALRAELTFKGMELGSPVFLRIFKEESRLEAWLRSGDTYKLYKSWEVCKYSGNLGRNSKKGTASLLKVFTMSPQNSSTPTATTTCPSTSASRTPSTSHSGAQALT